MFKHRQHLFWFEFAPIIRRAQARGCSIHIVPPSTKLGIVTLLDGNKPLRDGCIDTGYSSDDWSRDSIICNSSWHNGALPIYSIPGYVYRDQETWDEITVMPVRGVIGTLEMLLSEKVITETPEVKELMRMKRA